MGKGFKGFKDIKDLKVLENGREKMLARRMKNAGILFSLVIVLAQIAVWGRV